MPDRIGKDRKSILFYRAAPTSVFDFSILMMIKQGAACVRDATMRGSLQ